MSDIEVPDKLVSDLKTGVTYDDIKEEYDLSPDQARRRFQVLREEGVTIDHKVVDGNGKRLFYIPDEIDKTYRFGDGDGNYKFGLISDTHLGSSAEHLEELHDYYDRVEEEDIDVVFHAGDISDGHEVHTGHLNVLKPEAIGWGRLKEYVVENYPQREGVHTFFISGNHDHKLHRRQGVRLGEMIAEERDDLHWLGDSMAQIMIDPENDIDMELIHPSGGKPYTAGYRVQTLYRERPADQRPTIAAIGHLHGSMFVKTEDVYGFYTGAWKGLTTYGKRKGHHAAIGGWIVELDVEDGELRRISPDWIGYEANDDTPNMSFSDINDLLDDVDT